MNTHPSRVLVSILVATVALSLGAILPACSGEPASSPDADVDRPDGGGGVVIDAGTEPGDPDAATEPDEFAKVCTPRVEFVNQSAGGNGRLFDEQVANPEAYIQAAALTICKILYRDASEVPSIPMVRLVIEDMDGVAYASGGEVHFSSQYMSDYASGGGDLAYEIAGVIHHEFTHVYQYNDGPGWLIEGVADYVRYRAGFVRESSRRRGGNYDDAYNTTAFFLDWVDTQHAGFGYEINQSLASDDNVDWSLDVFSTLTGSDVDSLWSDYQASLP